MTQRSRRTLRGVAATGAALTLTLGVVGGGQAAPNVPTSPEGTPAVEQPELESRVKEIIEQDGLQFRDLNSNGDVDPYEDWRLSSADRATDLVEQMTLEERAGLMLIDTLNADCTDGQRGTLGENAEPYILGEHMHRLIFRNVVTSPDQAECGEGGGGFQASTSLTPAEAATYMNAVQELSESSRLGLPVLYKSNARNHIDPDARAGINESAGAFTAFPKEAGIASAALGEEALATGENPAVGDMAVVEDFAEVMGAEWESIGLRGMYGYMADLSTEPRWYRAHETFTEDADLAANLMTTLVETLQGPVDTDGNSLTPDTSVALTMKHFPGGGPQELGLDPHFSFGKAQVYPGDAFGEHLKPFVAAIEAGVSSIMPYYGVPVDVSYNGTDYEEVGMAFSDQIVNQLLRDELGFQGYVNSDTGIINDRAWGLEENTVPERVAAAINGGTDTLSGFHDVATITDLVNDGLVTEERVELAATRLVTPMFDMGLFENPYVDPAHATETVGSEAHREVGLDLQRKSAVLLQNGPAASGGGKTLPFEAGASVYVLGDIDPEAVAAYGYDVTDGNVEEGEERPSAEGHDYLLVSMTSSNEGSEAYVSNDPAYGLNPDHINPSVIEGFAGLDGESTYGAADACVAYGAESCTDDGLRFGGSFPWESSILDFTGMEAAESWQVTPSLSTVQQATAEVGDPNKVVLNVYFRQPFVLDEASGLRDAGAIVADFGTTDTALLDVLSGEFAPQGKMPFALAGTSEAILEQASDLPGYEDTEDGALFPFGFGLTYEDAPEVQRIDGDHRYATAAEIAVEFPEGTDTVYIANGLEAAEGADALAAGAAGARGVLEFIPNETPQGDPAPILLVKDDLVPQATTAALEALNPSEIVIVGGTLSVNADVEARLAESGADVRRVAGDNRYETAAQIAAEYSGVDTVYVATGRGAPDSNLALADALTASSVAGSNGAPVVLTRPDLVPAATQAVIADLDPDNIVVVGGPEAISDEVLAALGELAPAERVAGDNRYETAAALTQAYAEDGDTLYVASGATFPDALAGGSLSGSTSAPMLLTRADLLPSATAAEIERLSPQGITILGGPESINTDVEAKLQELLDTTWAD
ncbi:cell wall-binding repeat-containing protein [Ornithinimicrobium faecis]|uniref:beta-glucosidase n=1 Tax=Ornithinimicrobium faecis TaxID=2934158 RepID=A0ABY4YTX8_9MICO|nr:cell wall-binding repeat-containing protein [Ornithinimicrobium sp. HY1793]USQ80198.1 cell wall-binding repeat-containing protein [Ornithinimicrobium sp. HY1793]